MNDSPKKLVEPWRLATTGVARAPCFRDSRVSRVWDGFRAALYVSRLHER